MLGVKPRIAIVLRDGVPRHDVDAAMSRGGDMVEMRVDLYGDTGPDHVCHEALRLQPFPRIGTIRSSEEGGGWQGRESERLDLFRKLAPVVDAIDVELSATSIAASVVDCAKEANIPVIGSFHDFQGTPDRQTLDNILHNAETLGVSITKIATNCTDADALRRLARLLMDHPERPLVIIGMGAAGLSSRVFFPLLGSMVAYTFLGAPSAPGQLNLEDTVRYIRLFSGGEDR